MINDKEIDYFSLVSDINPKTFQWINNQEFRFGGIRITEDTVFVYKAITSDIEEVKQKIFCTKCENNIESETLQFCNKCGTKL